VRDIHSNLIPAWRLEHGLRPGTVVCVTATLHVYNIKNYQGKGFRRVRFFANSPIHLINNHAQYFQIDAEKIWVVAEPIENDIKNDKDKGKCKEENTDIPIIDDFTIYMNKKRKCSKIEDNPSPKKKKQDESSTEDEMNED
jgi:hypothetical protein